MILPLASAQDMLKGTPAVTPLSRLEASIVNSTAWTMHIEIATSHKAAARNMTKTRHAAQTGGY